MSKKPKNSKKSVGKDRAEFKNKLAENDKKATDIIKGKPPEPTKDQAENPKAVTGDNILTEDQTRAIFFDHLKLIKKCNGEIAEIEVELRAAKKSLKDAKKLAQSEGTKLVDIETALRLEDGDEKVIKGEIEAQIKVARWLNIPMGFQMDMLDADRRPAEDRAFEEGKIAGLKGGSRKPPHDPMVPQHARWLEGYAEGQAVLSKKFQPPQPKTDVPQGSTPKDPAEAAKKEAADKAKVEAAKQPPAEPLKAPAPSEESNVISLQQPAKAEA